MNPLAYLFGKWMALVRVIEGPGGPLRASVTELRRKGVFPAALCRRITGIVYFHQTAYTPADVFLAGAIRERIIAYEWDKFPPPNPVDNLAEDDIMIWKVILCDGQPHCVLETLSFAELWANDTYRVLMDIAPDRRAAVMAFLSSVPKEQWLA